MDTTPATAELPLLRWGIIGSGTIARWFTKDLLVPRADARIRHRIYAVGSPGAADLVQEVGLPPETKIYRTHAEAYADPNVDIVHIGVPHGLHLAECLAAIQAGKHVLCEKPLAVNAKEAHIIFEAAQKANVWIGEGLWTRALPITRLLTQILHEKKDIGRVERIVADFGFLVDLDSLPWTNKHKDPRLGAGSLLDMGVYLINWALLVSSGSADREANDNEGGQLPKILATQTLNEVAEDQFVETATGILMQFSPEGPQAILSSTSVSTRERGNFCRIDGTEGHITLSGMAPPLPTHFTVYKRSGRTSPHVQTGDDTGIKYAVESPGGMGFYWEADEAGLDILSGRTTSSMMPPSQTMLVMRIMDEVRRQGGAKFPQDDET